MVEMTLKQNGSAKRLLFTGDIGRVHDTEIAPGKVVHSGPNEGETADVVVMESTYGNRDHPKNDPRPQMAQLIRDTVHGADVSSYQRSRWSVRKSSFSC